MASNFDSSMLVSQNIIQASSYLTYPLNLIHDKSTVFSAQLILQSTLNAAYQLSPESELIFSLSISSLPALPILAACVAANIMWADWIMVLGGRDVELVIQSRAVFIRATGSTDSVIMIWEALRAQPRVVPSSNLSRAHVPISKLGRSLDVPQVIGNSIARPSLPRTLAQRLLEDDVEEADEIFAMIKDAPNIISPTPTREKFTFSALRIQSPVSPPSSPEPASSESSRPSSRSSSFSTYSFSSSDESSTSISTAEDSEFASSPVLVDSNKKDVTKYLYQGGVSTVLTGGVMLGGCTTASKPKPKAELIETPTLYRARIGMKKLIAPKIGASADSWRRPARSQIINRV